MSKRVSKIGWIVLGILLSIPLVIFPACGGGGDGDGGGGIPLKNPNDFVQMTIGDVDSFDPAYGYDQASGEQVQLIYETLIYYDGENGDKFVPILATEWNASEDGLTIRFKIRQGVKFAEGGDLTPEDVEYSFEKAMVQDRDAGPVWMLYYPLLGVWGSRDGDGNIQVTFEDIDNAVEVDGEWVQFNLIGPYPTLTFYQIMCGAWASIVDKEWCITNGEWDGTAETWESFNNLDKEDGYLYDKTNGTGPWKLELWDPGIQIKLVRNDNYWRAPAPFERVITQIVDEWTTRKLALLAGDADWVYVPRMYIGELEGIADLNVYKDLPQLIVDCFFYNMCIAENSEYIGSGTLDGNGIPLDFFTDENVRKGFSCAFDYDVYMKDVLLNEAKRVGSPIVDGLLYYNPNASMYNHDLDKAAEYLQAAWGGEVWEKGFEFTLLYNSGNVARKTACEILAEHLYAINEKFTIKIQPLSWPTILGKIFGGRDMPAYQIGWQADYPDPDNFVVPFMGEYGSYSYWQCFNNPRADELITEGITTIDPTARQAIYYELQQLYYDYAPGIALAQPLGRRYFTKYIHGFYFNPMIYGDSGPLYYMSKSAE